MLLIMSIFAQTVFNGSGDLPIFHGEGERDPDRKLFNSPVFSDISGTVELFEGSYWTIAELEITNSIVKTGSTDLRSGILIIDDCKTSVQMKAEPSYGLTGRDCYIHDVVSDDREKRTGGILILGNWHDVLVDGNVLERVLSAGDWMILLID